MRRLFALVAVLACAPALAQETPGPYVGLGYGQIEFKDSLLIWFDISETDTTPSLIAGYRFSDKLAFEAKYAETAEFRGHLSAKGVPTFLDHRGGISGGDIEADVTGDFDVVELSVLAHAGSHLVLGFALAFTDYTAEIAGIGDYDPETPGMDPFNGGIENSDNSFAIIIGAQFDFGKWGIRPEYEYYDLSSPATASSLSVQFHYGF